MRKPLAQLMVRMLILPPPSWCRCPSITVGSLGASAVWMLMGQLESFLGKVMYLHFPSWTFGFYHSCGLFQLILKSFSLIRNCPRVAFAQLQGQQVLSPPLLCICGIRVALALAQRCCSQHRSGWGQRELCVGPKTEQESSQQPQSSDACVRKSPFYRSLVA